MLVNTCPRCENKFYTAVTCADINCPYCGFLVKCTEHEARGSERHSIQKICALFESGEQVFAHTTDISESGVGITMEHEFPFYTGAIVNVKIDFFDIESDAQVVWVKKSGPTLAKAGLKFRRA
ncbi:MAG: hypothetical protein A2X93_03640 [Deltaproteobacteria bacterium GWC2_56_8]|nr:MAG: hypothetical protein A2X99_11905 [Deltaproteobacteria bacterium GWB2_55_19]OGP32429.1 MAG: hypothetical protein A2X93_03640 [Deltaproteobacteria bacterium GWC2_56_8]HAO93334.1 hypothetical protein [Deltaproteobacteria bacterium]